MSYYKVYDNSVREAAFDALELIGFNDIRSIKSVNDHHFIVHSPTPLITWMMVYFALIGLGSVYWGA